MERKPWTDLFREFSSNPGQFAQDHWIWLIAIMIILFLLSRLNNYLEITGVNKAIYVSRAFVSTITAFVITPIAFILFLNLIAWRNNYEWVSVGNIGQWLMLTGSSYLWLLKSAVLTMSGIPGKADQIYTTSSIVRLLWILLPITFVWFRIAGGMFWRLLLIPLFLGSFFVTRFQPSAPTFLDKHIPEGMFEFGSRQTVDNSTTNINRNKDGTVTIDSTGKLQPRIVPKNKKYSSGSRMVYLGLLGLMLAALVAGFFLKAKVIPMLVVAALIGAFITMVPPSEIEDKTTIEQKEHPVEIIEPSERLNRMITNFEELYFKKDPNELDDELFRLSERISNTITAEDVEPPGKLCRLYRQYFRDLCE